MNSYLVTVIAADTTTYKGQVITLTQEQWDEYIDSSHETYHKVYEGETTYEGQKITVYTEL